MEKASDYYDFVVRLGHKACDDDVSHELAYMAAKHVLSIREEPIQNKLRRKFSDRPEIAIWTYPCRSQVDRTMYHDEFHEILDLVIKTNPPDWILIDLFYLQGYFFSQTPADSSNSLMEIDKLLRQNPKLKPFEPYSHDIKSSIYWGEGDHVNAILEQQRTIRLAKALDDSLLVTETTRSIAGILKNHNAAAALEYTEEFNTLSMELGIPWLMMLARNTMGLIYLILGEYDMALECELAAAELYYQDKGASDTLSTMISSIHCEVGDGATALHWVENALEFTNGEYTSHIHQLKSWALVLLNRLDEAEQHMNLLHKMSLKSGTELEMAHYLHIRGLFELASELPSEAMKTLEEALSVIEPLNIQVLINRILIALTKAEIESVFESSSEDSSGPWMLRLESHARKKAYLGIQMQAALLRAEFYAKRGRNDEAKEVLQNALTILDSPTVKTIRNKIKKMLDDLVVA